MVRVAILGAGFMGVTHARAYGNIPDATVDSITDNNAEKASKLAVEIGSRMEPDPEKMFCNPAIDVVDINVPTPFHPQLAIRAFLVGKHVIIEKPLALTLPEADSLLEAAERSGKYLMVAHVIRFWPEYEVVQDIIRSGRIGKPILATAYRLSSMPQWADWFRDPAQFGGAVLDLHIHDLDFMNLLFGTPKKTAAVGQRDETGSWNHVITQLEYETGRASVEATCMLPRDFPFTAGFRISCERGALEYHFRAGGASFEQGTPSSYLLLHEPGRPSQELACAGGDGYTNELAYFIKCVKSGTPPTRITPQDARLAVQTALMSREALERSETISWG